MGVPARARTQEMLEAVRLPDPAGALRSATPTSSGAGASSERISLSRSPSAAGLASSFSTSPRPGSTSRPRRRSPSFWTGLCRDFGLALILVTHDLPVVAQLCNRCAVMYAGEIVERGPLEAIYHTPGHPYSRMLFAASPDLDRARRAGASRSPARPRGSTGRLTAARSDHAATPSSRPCGVRAAARATRRRSRRRLPPQLTGARMSVARLRLAPVGETMFPPRCPLLLACVGKPPGFPTPLPHAHRSTEVGP